MAVNLFLMCTSGKIIRVILTAEDEGFLLVTLDFSGFDLLFLVRSDTFQQDRRGLVSRVLRDKLASNGEIEDLCLCLGNEFQDVTSASLNAVRNIHHFIKISDKPFLLCTWRKRDKCISNDSLIDFRHTACASGCVCYVIFSGKC